MYEFNRGAFPNLADSHLPLNRNQIGGKTTLVRRLSKSLSDISSFTSGSQSAADAFNSIARLIPGGSGGSQTDAGRWAEGGIKVGSALMKLAPTLAEVPVAAAVVEAVGLVMVAASTLVNKIAGTSKAKQLKEEAGQYEAANAQIRIQVDEVNYHNSVTATALNKLNSVLENAGWTSGLNGFGNLWEDIFDPGAEKRAQYLLDSSQQENVFLKEILDKQTSQLSTRVNQFNDLLNQITVEGQNRTMIKKVAAWSMVGIALTGVTYLCISSFSQPKKRLAAT